MDQQMTYIRLRMEQPSCVVDKIASSLQRELLDLQNLSSNCSIYRVPHRLRKVDEKAYTPQVVSIGPLHYGRKELKLMEEHKRRYLHHFLQLCPTVTLNNFVEFIRDNETRLRNCYAEFVQLSSEEFVKMILVDSAFVIVVFLKGIFNLELPNDRIFGKPKMIYEIRFDMLLLENQIPFFILKDLFELSKLPEHLPEWFDLSVVPGLFGKVDLVSLAYLFIEGSIMGRRIAEKNYSANVDHLVHFLRICYIPPSWHVERKATTCLSLPSAAQLHQVGVEFRPRSTGNLFDMKFADGILEIPPLEIVDSTETLFHNLRAFEQCHCLPSPNFLDKDHTFSKNEHCHCLHELFSDYIAVMFQLVKGPKDVEFLVQKGIIRNRAFSSERVLRFFHNLDAEIIISSQLFCYSTLMEDLNKYSLASWPKWKATLKQNYFRTPWATISVVAAGFLLTLTVVQTVCSIIQVKQPPLLCS